MARLVCEIFIKECVIGNTAPAAQEHGEVWGKEDNPGTRAGWEANDWEFVHIF